MILQAGWETARHRDRRRARAADLRRRAGAQHPAPTPRGGEPGTTARRSAGEPMTERAPLARPRERRTRRGHAGVARARLRRASRCSPGRSAPQNPGANAFALANQLPNNIYAIVAAGVLSAVLVPQIVRAGLHADGGQALRQPARDPRRRACSSRPPSIATLCAPLLVDLYTPRRRRRRARRRRPGARDRVRLLVPAADPLLRAVLAARRGAERARRVRAVHLGAGAQQRRARSSTLLIFAASFGVDPAHQDPAAGRRRRSRCSPAAPPSASSRRRSSCCCSGAAPASASAPTSAGAASGSAARRAPPAGPSR